MENSGQRQRRTGTGKQLTTCGNVFISPWVEPCWTPFQTAAPQEPWHSISLPTKQMQAETVSIFFKSQLDVPPAGEAACPCDGHIRTIDFLPAVSGKGSPCVPWGTIPPKLTKERTVVFCLNVPSLNPSGNNP